MRRQSLCAILFAVVAMIASTVQAQSMRSGDHYNYQTAEFNFFQPNSNHKPSRAAFRLMSAGAYSNAAHSRFSLTAAAANPVVGSGSAGRIAKWSGVIGTNTFVLGNSSITEDKFGQVGIGTSTPTSPLTVAGLIETISPGGGIKFADGTVQTTSATGALFSIAHDATLTGNGTAASPLGVAIPLRLEGVNALASLLDVSNTGGEGDGIQSRGGAGGNGVIGAGGNSNNSPGGNGVVANGGTSNSDFGGNGMDARGGNSTSSNGGNGVRAFGGNSTSGLGGDGLFAIGGVGPLGNGLAGDFNGNVDVSGMLSKGGGSFKIDHPLDPENRYLLHSFVESPDMMNVYNGNITTDANGEAVVQLPAYFEALNRDFRYQLTVIGAFAQAIVAEEIKDNRFLIRTNAPKVKVSWQVTGIRQDEWANRNRIKVEVDKTERERGYYLHHEAFDQPEERSVEWARNPQLMQQRKDARERAKQKQQ